jgi:hypothetical protein
MNIELDGPKTLTLSPNTLIAVLNGLQELPHKFAAPAIEEITAQLKTVPKEE